ncbi:MAG: sigma-54-dependent Fis family transcriptional regulator [Bacteroidota bacterium]
MQQKNPEADAILKAIQGREKDHQLQLSLCTALSQVTDRSGLAQVVQQLKGIINFDAFTICITDEYEKEYRVFFHDNPKSQSELKGVVQPVNDGYFDTALQSAEPVSFNLINPAGKNGLPVFMLRERQTAMREAVAMPLHYHKSNPAVLFLFFKNPRGFTSPIHRLLKGLSMQLALTVTNSLIIEKTVLLGSSQNTTTPTITPENQASEALSDDKFPDIIGQGATMQKVITLIKQVAPSDSGVLLLGESGTGKEVIACAIHKHSARNIKEMVKVNCAAIPANLIESELFGHEKGSFTGATARRIGKFEQANNGTLFLDEIGELPFDLQTKLLRVIQENEFERIGGTKTIKVNVRIIAATNRNLLEEIAMGRFRTDLFYRINIFPIHLPALRERKEDIAALSTHFIHYFCSKAHRKSLTLSSKALKNMMIYSWPGNVRELKHALERSLLLATGTTITEMQFPEIQIVDNSDHHIKSLEEVEKEHILKVIKICSGRISGPNGAAEKLGIRPTTLLSKMQKLDIKKGHTIK